MTAALLTVLAAGTALVMCVARRGRDIPVRTADPNPTDFQARFEAEERRAS